MNDELDQQAAEARGWKKTRIDQDYWEWHDENNTIHVFDYLPSTDLNQAMSFAEWALTELSIFHGHKFYISISIMPDLQELYAVQIMTDIGSLSISQTSKDGLAALITKTTLMALQCGSLSRKTEEKLHET